MFQQILVPLDGSKLSEQAIPYAARIARSSHATIQLVHVVVSVGITSPTPFQLMQESLDEAHRKAKVYLTCIAESSDLAGIKTQIKIFYEHPVYSIIDTAQTDHADLIIMCSRGRGKTGLARWVLGSVAQKVVRLSPVPVLVLQPEELQQGGQKPGAEHVRILVGLDGSPFAEAAISPATNLATALAAPGAEEIHLIEFVQEPTFEEMLSVEQSHLDANLIEIGIQRAQEYLRTFSDKVAVSTAQSGVTFKWLVETCTDIADSLIQKAEGKLGGQARPYDMLVLTTHGRGGLQRWLMGSITERILQHIHVPVLVVHPQQDATQSSSSSAVEPSTPPVGG